jgi:UDP-N-acetyl-D-mannosaminuronic acid dehydrogenase
MSFLERIRDRSATIGIVGMGRVGLPLGIAFSRAGFHVVGLETDHGRRTAIELGKMPFHEPGAEEFLHEAVSSGRLSVRGDAGSVIPHVDAIILCVGTPLSTDLRADYDQLTSALGHLVPHLRAGQLVVLRSTVSPDTLVKVLFPFIQREAPLVAGDLLVAACPERIAEGRAMEELRTLPEIVGGIDDASTEAAAELFQSLGAAKTVNRTNPTSAELAKLFTNVYRYVNFALANEFAILGEQYGVDAHRIIQMANQDYPRANIPIPGPAGGPCLSKDGYFLVEELTLPDFVLLAWKLNESAAAHIVRRLGRHLARHDLTLSGTPIAVLGQGFKRDSDDARQSPAVRIAQILTREGADVRVHDPFFPGLTLDQALDGASAFVLATNHSAYESLDPKDMYHLMDPPRVGMDSWGMLDRDAFAAAGIKVLAFGVGEDA